MREVIGIRTIKRVTKMAVLTHSTYSTRLAPGSPGISARWTSSAKTGVGTALSNKSRVWFTLSHGIFNEIYYPRIDQACIRDMGFIVTDGATFFSEEKRDAESEVHWLAEGVPAFGLLNISRDGRYRIEKQIVTDPNRDTVLQQVTFIPQQGELSDYHLYVLLAPHLGNQGSGNSAWVDDVNGRPVLFASRDGSGLALICSAPWTKRSVGYVGSSDGWQDLKAHRRLTSEYTRAEYGNVAVTGEIDLLTTHGVFVLALGFGKDANEAARNAVASLDEGFDKAKHNYIDGWQKWTTTRAFLDNKAIRPLDLSTKSLAVLRTHESKHAPGALIASLAIPWGSSHGDSDQGGYHLVWSRDMVETAGGLLAAGAHEDARRVLSFLQSTQRPDGHWPQNMWLDGSPYWDGIQMDETALPILLVDLANREKALVDGDLASLWPMVKKAAGYLARSGPVSPQDRWEEDPGYTPFTVAAEIAALLAAADLADLNHETSVAMYLREIADVWNSSIERWMYMSATDWCARFKVDGYYVRIAPKQTGVAGSNFQPNVAVKNVTASEDTRRASHLISPDALALVRFGLRTADDPRILDTATVIDALLKVETPSGPVWHRYNDDGYGEHEDGSPFDGTGIGRGWPLLTGERAHYELAAGRTEEAKRLLTTLESFANSTGLISEQIWDCPDIPECELYFGRPSGSAMPLVWAHAEHLKLQRSLRDGRLFDMPAQTVKRYLIDKTESPRLTWRYNHNQRSLQPGKILRVELMASAAIHWTSDDWHTTQDISTLDTGLGIHIADLRTGSIAEGAQIRFTFYWSDAKRWEGANFVVRIAAWRRDDTIPAADGGSTDGK
jgi:glucoamylase